MVSHTSNRASPWLAGTAVASFGQACCRALSSLFEVTRPEERERLAHRVALVMLLLCGCVVRFWGLANVGLHGDEETMAMATMGIVKHGAPLLPSGI